MSNLEEKKKVLEDLLKTQVAQFQSMETARSNMANGILELRGKISMLEELIKEETNNTK